MYKIQLGTNSIEIWRANNMPIMVFGQAVNLDISADGAQIMAGDRRFPALSEIASITDASGGTIAIPDTNAAYVTLVISWFASFSTPQSNSREIGEIIFLGFELAPEDPRNAWLLACDGRQVFHTDEQNYPELFAAIRYRFGGNGSTFYHLPDARGKSLIGPKSGVYNVGGTIGAAEATLTAANLPTHNVTIRATGSVGDLADPSNAYIARNAGGTAIKSYRADRPLAATMAADAAQFVNESVTPISTQSPALAVGVYIVYA